ncbi:MAG: DUF4249 family protein, partial [Bacteroidetes bacterium]|nr:DUF4249 family protein [Bacteroidota bacterium]
MKAIFIFMFPFVFLYSSCSDNSFTELDTANVPVVEAYLKVGQPLSVKIRTVIPYGTSSTNVVDINTLTVTVTVDTITRQLLSVGGGNYVDSSLVIAENKEYELQVNYNGKMVTASTVVPTKPENFSQSASEITIPTFDFNSGTRPTFPDPVKLTWVNT